MTVYNELIQGVDSGENFYIDFETRTIKVGKNFLAKDGKYDDTRALIGYPTVDILQSIEELYQSYKYSLPSERNSNKRNNRN